MTRALAYARHLFLAVVILFLAGPFIIVAGVSLNATRRMSFPPPQISLDWYAAFFTSPAWLSSFFWSVFIAAGAALIATSVALPICYGIWRYSAGTGRFFRVLCMAATSHLVIPAVILAIVFMIFWGWAGHVGRPENTMLSHAGFLLALPISTIMLGFSAIDRSTIDAASTMGARSGHIFLTIVLPVIAPYIVCGILLVFILSMNEYIIAFMVAGFSVETLPIRVFNSMRLGYEPTMCVAAIVFMAVGLTTFSLIARFADLPKLLGAR